MNPFFPFIKRTVCIKPNKPGYYGATDTPDVYELTYLLDFFRFFALMLSYFTRELNWFETVFCLPLIITGLHHIIGSGAALFVISELSTETRKRTVCIKPNKPGYYGAIEISDVYDETYLAFPAHFVRIPESGISAGCV